MSDMMSMQIFGVPVEVFDGEFLKSDSPEAFAALKKRMPEDWPDSDMGILLFLQFKGSTSHIFGINPYVQVGLPLGERIEVWMPNENEWFPITHPIDPSGIETVKSSSIIVDQLVQSVPSIAEKILVEAFTLYLLSRGQPVARTWSKPPVMRFDV